MNIFALENACNSHCNSDKRNVSTDGVPIKVGLLSQLKEKDGEYENSSSFRSSSNEDTVTSLSLSELSNKNE